MNFFEQLATSTGKNVKFKIRNVEEDEVTAWVNWHLGIQSCVDCRFMQLSVADLTNAY